MKYYWKFALTILCCSAFHVLAAVNTPTDDVIQQQFAKESGGTLRLDKFTVHQLDVVGNQATYELEGDMSSSENLYTIVGAGGDYLFYERTWTKGLPVKFSAMMHAIGSRDSGWKVSFFSMQTAARNVGRPFEEGEDLSKMLVVNDAHFMTHLGKVEARFAERKTAADKDLVQQKALAERIATIDEQIMQSWGKDANGKVLDRSAVQQAMLEKMYVVDRENDPLKFEDHYLKTVYEPALADCQKKLACDEKPLRDARDAALAGQKSEFYRQHQLMAGEIREKMAALDNNVAPLRKEQGELQKQLVALETSTNEFTRDYKFWREGLEKMRKEGVIQ
jgi:Protein of unknown function (DUF1202).